ncbi:MAG TPA: PhzF family phenazine biosynthesis protein [Gemmatimonadaceae bacterium]
MEQLRYFVVDAFTSHVFHGNPAGVCPLERWPSDDLLQAIAAENNLAETAFFVPDRAGYHLRWFTPTQEVPLCGHATLATAFVIFGRLRPELRDVRFQTRSGPLTVRRDDEWLELELPRYTPARLEVPPRSLGDGLGIEASEVLRVEEDPNYYVIVADEATVRGVRPRLDVLAALHPYGVAVSAPGRSADFVSRYFAPSYGIPEDPVTGSIHAALTPYWAARLNRSSLRAAQLSRRGGELRCRLTAERVLVAGRAAAYLEGTIAVPVGIEVNATAQ